MSTLLFHPARPALVRLLGLLLLAWLALALRVNAQAPGGGTTGGPPAPQNTTDVPLDGGASLLLAGGLAYGLRRLRRGRAPRV